jgi:hypothetical protein
LRSDLPGSNLLIIWWPRWGSELDRILGICNLLTLRSHPRAICHLSQRALLKLLKSVYEECSSVEGWRSRHDLAPLDALLTTVSNISFFKSSLSWTRFSAFSWYRHPSSTVCAKRCSSSRLSSRFQPLL